MLSVRYTVNGNIYDDIHMDIDFAKHTEDRGESP